MQKNNSPFHILFSLTFLLFQQVKQAYSIFRVGNPQAQGLSDWTAGAKFQHYNKLKDKYLFQSYSNTFKIFEDHNRGDTQKYTNQGSAINLKGINSSTNIAQFRLIIDGNNEDIAIHIGSFQSPIHQIKVFTSSGTQKQSFNITFSASSNQYWVTFFQNGYKPFLFIYQFCDDNTEVKMTK